MKQTTQLGFLTICFSLAIVMCTSCGEENSAEIKTIPIDFSVEEKIILVNSFANLTDNEDLNLFEDGIANMLEEALVRIPGTQVIPRRSINKFMAVNSTEDDPSLKEIAEKKKADYVIDGWISRFKDDYRLYANLLNVKTGKADEKFAVATFKNKEEAVLSIKNFIEDISAKLGNSPEEINNSLNYQNMDYDVFSLRLQALSSYYKGRPDIAASMLEQALDRINRQIEEKTAEPEDTLFEARGYLHFLLAQIHAEMHNWRHAAHHVEAILPFKDRLNPMAQRIVEAIQNLVDGDYAEAKLKYADLISQYPNNQDFYIRLADIMLLNGESIDKAIDVLHRGVNLNPDETRLHREIAKLQMQKNGEEEVETYAINEMEKEKYAVGNEMVSTMVSIKMKENIAKAVPGYVKVGEAAVGEVKAGASQPEFIGHVEIDIQKLEENLDYSCPDATMHAFKLANLAITSGNDELAERIANIIEVKGKAANSKDVSVAIRSMLSAAEGDMTKAKEFINSISSDEYIRTVSIANYLINAGKYEKAAYVYKKAIKESDDEDPMLLYNIAHAYMLAGNYKEWDKYNTLFLERTAKMNMLPKRIKLKLEERWHSAKPVKDTKQQKNQEPEIN